MLKNIIKQLLFRKAKSRLTKKTSHKAQSRIRDDRGRFTTNERMSTKREIKFTFMGEEQAPIIMYS